ncbi:hypothetical protein BDAP_000920 [Binucleata daphniae]
MSINQITKLVFLGSGPSSGVPNLHCLATKRCKNCLNTKNKRTNVSLLIECTNGLLLIDCTKDFYTQYKNYLLKKIRNDMKKEENMQINNHACCEIDCKHNNNGDCKACNKNGNAECKKIHTTTQKPIDIDDKSNKMYEQNIYYPKILITHEHADAVLGLDYIRQTTSRNFTTKLYSDKKTGDYLKNHFSYLFVKSTQNTTNNGAIEFNEIESNKTMYVDDIEILPFHVEHGNGTVALAFLIENKILYVSDCSNFDTVIDCVVDILIADCTTFDKFSYGHSNFFDVIRLIKRLKPKKTYLIGMSHLIDYDELVVEVKKYAYDIHVAYDGLEVEINY